MVIGRQHKYLFIELPRTGTTAISEALCRDYDGEKHLNKHTNLFRARRESQEDFTGYFVFSCIRHPMDRTVSVYEKYRSNYRNIRESYTKKYKKLPWWNFFERFIRYQMLRRVRFAQKPGMTFERYFLKYYKAPYSDWAILEHKEMDAVIRFENLEGDFKKVCEEVGMNWRGRIGKKNVTESKKKQWQEYYSEQIADRTRWVFTPYLYDFDYAFPGEKKTCRPAMFNRFAYHFINIFRKPAWKYFNSGK